MRKILIYCAMLILIFPIVAKAYECTGTDKERLQKFANNVSVVLEEQTDGTFVARFSGLSDEIKVYSSSDNLSHYSFSQSKIGETLINDLRHGEVYKFVIYGTNKCQLVTFRTITVNIPDVNPFYGEKICDDALDYSLCQKWVNVNMSHDEFVEKVNAYIENKKSTDKNQNEDSNDKYFEFLEFYERYYWLAFSIMIGLLILLICLWKKENKKNKL